MEGTIAPTSRKELEAVRKEYRMYSLIYPFMYLFSLLRQADPRPRRLRGRRRCEKGRDVGRSSPAPAGFIGSHFVPYLAARGWRCGPSTCTRRRAGVAGQRRGFSGAGHPRAAGLAAALEGVDTCSTWPACIWTCMRASRQFEAVNVKALEQLIELCACSARAPARAGEQCRRLRARQAPACGGGLRRSNPQNDYERTKIAGEEAARELARRAPGSISSSSGRRGYTASAVRARAS